MMISLLTSAVFLFTLEATRGLILDIPRCGQKFYCPDHCNISWSDDCPRNCFCGPAKYCPLVTCPASYPVCLVFTMRDGCQSCACKIPFAFLKANESVDDARLMYGDADHLRQMREGQNFTDQGGNEVIVAKKVTCTIESMNRIDICLRRTLDFHKFALERKRGDQPVTINPMVLLGDRDMRTLCGLFTDAVKCVGEDMYKDCRRDHADLSEMDSLLSFACGPESAHFFQHFPCISSVHKDNPRLQLCEDLFVNTLVVVQESTGPAEQKRAQKCRALSWFLKCGKLNVYRRCSSVAADIYAKSLMSATEYMAPGCRPDFENGIILERPVHKADFTLLKPKEALNCSMTDQFAVYALFGSLYKEVRALIASSTPAFPVAYAYDNTALIEKCKEFRSALYQLPIDMRIRCYRNFQVFDQVYGVFVYPCAASTRALFFHHFDCLKSLRDWEAIADCDDEAERHLADPSVDQCEVYDLLARCTHGTVEKKCGYDAWDVHFQLLTLSVRRYVPRCTLTPIYRPAA